MSEFDSGQYEIRLAEGEEGGGGRRYPSIGWYRQTTRLSSPLSNYLTFCVGYRLPNLVCGKRLLNWFYKNKVYSILVSQLEQGTYREAHKHEQRGLRTADAWASRLILFVFALVASLVSLCPASNINSRTCVITGCSYYYRRCAGWHILCTMIVSIVERA